MIFKDGTRRAGFFEENIFKAPLKNYKEFEEFLLKNNLKKKQVPEIFR